MKGNENEMMRTIICKTEYEIRSG